MISQSSIQKLNSIHDAICRLESDIQVKPTRSNTICTEANDKMIDFFTNSLSDLIQTYETEKGKGSAFAPPYGILWVTSTDDPELVDLIKCNKNFVDFCVQLYQNIEQDALRRKGINIIRPSREAVQEYIEQLSMRTDS